MYFESSGIEHIPKEMIKKVIGKKNILTNICRIKTFNSIIFKYFATGFIEFMLKGKSLLDYANSIFSNKYEKSDKIILFFSIIKINFFWIDFEDLKMRKIYCTKC